MLLKTFSPCIVPGSRFAKMNDFIVGKVPCREWQGAELKPEVKLELKLELRLELKLELAFRMSSIIKLLTLLGLTMLTASTILELGVVMLLGYRQWLS